VIESVGRLPRGVDVLRLHDAQTPHRRRKRFHESRDKAADRDEARSGRMRDVDLLASETTFGYWGTHGLSDSPGEASKHPAVDATTSPIGSARIRWSVDETASQPEGSVRSLMGDGACRALGGDRRSAKSRPSSSRSRGHPVKADDTDAANTAEAYYDSADADAFYTAIWGGEDIHVGLYRSDGEDIAEASARTVRHMASKLDLKPGARVIDIGAGYGGAARYLAREIGAHVTCLNLSETENARNRRLTAEQGLEDRIEIVHGVFEDIPFPDNSFDVVWSQEAILHSGDRLRVLKEVSRVLKPGGDFIFTDPMRADDIDDAAAFQLIYERIHLPDMASIGVYRATLDDLGFETVGIEDLTHQLRNHYARVREELTARRHALEDRISPEYAERMLIGLSHWVEGADAGQLAWGVLHFRKR